MCVWVCLRLYSSFRFPGWWPLAREYAVMGKVRKVQTCVAPSETESEARDVHTGWRYKAYIVAVRPIQGAVEIDLLE